MSLTHPRPAWPNTGQSSHSESDKAINNQILNSLSKYLAKYGIGEGAFVYIADSAMVTPKNLEAIGNNLFITRLPANYKETGRVIADAVNKGKWRRR